MSGPLRRKVMLTIVAFVLGWPVAHAGLVARYGIDPWEFFGWSMYALPAPRIQIRVEVERDGETHALRAMGDLRRRVQAFARRRTAFGTLAPTVSLAQEIFAEDSTIDAVIIMTREITLDPVSTLLVGREASHRHERTRRNGSGT